MNKNINRHSKGAQIAGQKTGGQFKQHERQSADGMNTTRPRFSMKTFANALPQENYYQLKRHLRDAANDMGITDYQDREEFLENALDSRLSDLEETLPEETIQEIVDASNNRAIESHENTALYEQISDP